MITENLSTLKIHKLSQEQYDRELAAGRIDETALYLTPDGDVVGQATPQGGEIFNNYANNTAGDLAHAEGSHTVASGYCSHAEGSNTAASGYQSHTEGSGTIASKSDAHAEGRTTEASGDSAHAEGTDTTASGAASHAEGYNTTASADNAHAEGEDTSADGVASHAEGFATIAEGDYSHAEGYGAQVIGDYSHAEGYHTFVDATAAHASGYYTQAGYDYQFVCGTYNDNKENTLFEVGNGQNNDSNSNAFEIYQDGHAEVQTVGNTNNSVVHKQYLNGMIVPKAVQSENDFTDINKKYILSNNQNNLIYQYKNEPKPGMPTFTNRVRSAADPTNLNQVLNGVGYKHGVKYGFDWSTGAIIEETYTPTDYLPGYAIGVIRVTNNDIVRIKHIGFATNGTVDFITLVRPSDAPGIGCEGLNQDKLSKITTGGGHYTLIGSHETASLQDVEIHINTATFGWVVEDSITDYYLVFYSTITVAPEDLIITVNEEIEFMENTTITGWTPINRYQDNPEYLHRIISNLELRIINLEKTITNLS